MQKQLGSFLSLEKLFTQKKKVFFLFLNRIKIATSKWLIAAGSLEVGNSY